EQPFPPKIGARVIGYSSEEFFAADIGGCVVLRVVQRHLKFDRVVGGSRVPFLDARVKAFGKPGIIQPCPFVETNGTDYEGVPVPLRYRVPVPGGSELFEIFACREFPAGGAKVSYPVFPLAGL